MAGEEAAEVEGTGVVVLPAKEDGSLRLAEGIGEMVEGSARGLFSSVAGRTRGGLFSGSTGVVERRMGSEEELED